MEGGPSLARVTIAAPTRRMDIALPDTMLVAELMPHLLRHAEGALGEPAGREGGWVLRRATGAPLEPYRNLTSQGVRDGELLHLNPAREDWPELAYDDVVEVIAGGARRAGRSWSPAATRHCGLAVTAGALLLGGAGLALEGPPWRVPAIAALVVAAVLAVVGILLSRAFGDAGAGAVVAASGLPYAFLGGAGLVDGPPALLLASACLLVAGVAGHVGVAGSTRFFVAGVAAALTGLLTGLLAVAGLPPAGGAAVALTVAIGLIPAYPVVATWIGRLPFPDLPVQAEEMLRDKPVPSRSVVFAAVVRSGEVLTGLLISAGLCSVAATAYLARQGTGVVGILLIATAIVALLLRARLFATPHQRVPLLVAGFLGLAVLILGLFRTTSVLFVLAGAGLTAAVALTAALVYSRRPPSPYLGRAADLLDVTAIVALIPLACGVAGLFDRVRDLFASIGG